MRRTESSVRSTMNPKKEPGGEQFDVTSGGASEVLNTKARAFETMETLLKCKGE